MALDDYGSLLRSGFEAGMAPLRFGLEQQQLDNQTQQVAHNGALIAAKIRTEQAQSALDAQYATDVERVSKSNDPRALSWLLTKYPGQKDALKAAYDQMDDQSKQETIRGHSAIFSALSNGRVDLAVPILEDRIKADAAAGQDTVEDQRMLDWLKSGDPKAISAVKQMSGLFIGAVVPERFAAVTEQLGTGPGTPKVVGYGDRLVNSDGSVLYTAPDAPFTINAGDTRFGPTPPAGSQPGPLTVAAVAPVIIAQESGGNYAARNVETGALGAYQVMPATAQALASRIGLPWKPELMTSAAPEGKSYQDRIGAAAVQEAIDNSGGNPMLMAAYYHGGSDRSKWGRNTQQYAQEVSTRLRGDSGPTAVASIAAVAKPQTQLLTPEENTQLGLDPNVRYQRAPDGAITALGGQSKAQLKPIPTAAVKGIQENRSTVRQIDNAISELEKHKGAIGWGTGSLGDWFTNNVSDPKGVDARAAVGKIAGQIIHDVSGAAVTLSEEPRFRPYVPSLKDNAATALKKLHQLKVLAEGTLTDQYDYYSEAQGYRPYHSGEKQAVPSPPKTVGGGFKILSVRPK